MSTIAPTSSLKTTQMGWVEETTRGQVPNAAAFNDVLIQSFEVTPEIQNVTQTALGTAYAHKIVKTCERYRASIEFIPFDADILMYAVNRTGTKNVFKTLTWAVAQDMNQAGAYAAFYQAAKGATCNSITINGGKESINCSSEWFCSDVTTPATTWPGTGTPTWAPLTDAGWTGLTGGTGSIEWNSVAQTVRSYSITVNNNTFEDQFMGEQSVSYTTPTMFECSGTLDIIWSGTTLWADMKTFTPRLCKIELGPACFLTLTDAVIESGPLPRDATSTETTTVSYSIKAPKAEITTT